MTHGELLEKVTNNLNARYKEAGKSTIANSTVNDVVKETIETTKAEVAAGNKVALAGFGTFEPSQRSAREGRNPQTGEKMQIAATTVPKFKAAKAFKDILK